jgi:hypothetical protein
MAGQLNPTRVPSATHSARAHGTDIAEFAARTYSYRGSSDLDLWQCPVARLDDFWDALWKFVAVHSPSPHRRTRDGTMPHVRWFHGAHDSDVAHLFQSRPANTVAIIDVQEGAGSQQQTRQLTWAQLRAEAQALNPQAKSPWKISTTIASPGAAS